MRLSPKQLRVALPSLPDYRRIVLPGTVQSGKTWCAASAMVYLVATEGGGRDFGLCATSERQLERVIIRKFREWCERWELSLERVKAGYELESVALTRKPATLVPAYGRDASSAESIRGHTWAGAFIDEYPLMPEEFVQEVRNRCSEGPGRMVMTGNPRGPAHWAKVDMIDRIEQGTLEGTVIPFVLEDNPKNTPEDIADLYATYSDADGVLSPMGRRLLKGEWIALSGLVWPDFGARVMYEDHVPMHRMGDRYFVSIDVAYSSVTHALLIAQREGKHWVIDEWYYDHARKGQLNDLQQTAALVNRWGPAYMPAAWFVPPEAGSFRLALTETLRSRSLPGSVYPGENARSPGWQAVMWLLAKGLLWVAPRCVQLIRQGSALEWDAKKAALGEDSAVRGEDHGPDALRQYGYTWMTLSRGRR